MSNYKNLQFKQSNFSILTNILSSQFIYTSPNKIPYLKKISVLIQALSPKKTHFWYLVLLTHHKPYVKTFRFSWKIRAQKVAFMKPKTKLTAWKIDIKKKFLLTFLRSVLFDLFSTQHRLEKRILKLEHNSVRVVIPSAPLTFKTSLLQTKNNYLIHIPLTFKFSWTNVSLFQKMFILRYWRIIHQPNIKFLDEEWII